MPIDTLLLIEDNPGDVRLLREMLREEGSHKTRLTLVPSLGDAEKHLANHDVDVILLDLGLPDAQGLDAVRRARAAAPRVPLVVLTGRDDESLALQALKEGAQDYLVKGQIETRGLLRALRYAIERNVMEVELTSVVSQLGLQSTALEAAGNQMRDAHAQLSELLEHSSAVLYSLKISETIIGPRVASENLNRLLGFQVAETLTPEWWHGQLHPEDVERAEASVPITLSLGISRAEYRMRHKDGTYRWIDDNQRLVRNGSGAPEQLVGVWTDITERRNLEKQLLRTQRLDSLGTLAGGIAHDLNNLLLPIRIGVSLLRRLQTDENRLMTIDNIDRCARRGTDLVKRVLLFASGTDGAPTVVDLATIIAEVEAIAESTFPKSITFVKVMPEVLSSVVGDQTQLIQILLNLCVNARDAMAHGGQITISAANIEIDPHYAAMRGATTSTRDYVVIEVADDGTGIPDEIMERIFEPFFTTKELGKGTGLGLSTTQGVVRSHGGFIDASSEVGRGSTFRITLPAGTGLADPIKTSDKPVLRGSGEVILVVDDEVSILDITKQTLEAFGYGVLTAHDGAEAIALYVRDKATIAAVLTDMMMPVMDGTALIAAVRHINSVVPIIASTGRIEPNQMGRVIEAGATTFLPKPYSGEVMLRVLSEVLANASAPPM